MLRIIALGSGAGATTLLPTLKAAAPVANKPDSITDNPAKPPLIRASDLPIYETPYADYAEALEANSKQNKMGYVRETLYGPISTARAKFETVWVQTTSVTNSIQDKYHELQDRSDWVVKYLREEDNKEIRYGAVAIGGLTGFIFGLRGGIIRRVLYMGFGATGMGAICFPEETRETALRNTALARTYINIAYNFLYGVNLMGAEQEGSSSKKVSSDDEFRDTFNPAMSIQFTIT